jgi:hypothetical protein
MESNQGIIESAALKASQVLHIPRRDIDPFDLIRLYSLLSRVFGDHEGNMIHWLNTHNMALGFCPAARLTDKSSLNNVLLYLEGFLEC